MPALSLCDKSISFKCIFSPNEITSLIVPFIGAHECRDSKTCPNQMFDNACSDANLMKRTKRYQFDVKKNRFSANKINELCSSSAYNNIYCEEKPQNSASISASSSFQRDSSIEIEKLGTTSTSSTPCESQLSNMTHSGLMESSTLSSDSTLSCPIPTAIIWWRTTHSEHNQNRAIIGYSDGNLTCVRKFLLNKLIVFF